MSLKRFGALSIALLLVVAAMPAFAADATVGSFVIKLAKARNLAATDARIATDSLRGVGMRLPASLDHSKQLTEGEVARIARMMGINVSTSTPDDSFSSEQVDRFFVSFGSDLGGSTVTTNGGDGDDGDDDGPAFNPYSKGKGGSKGKKKGHDFTPTEPE